MPEHDSTIQVIQIIQIIQIIHIIYVKTTVSLLDPSHPLPGIISAQDTGDVLLFKSQGTFPQLIRAASRAAAMNGRYDHVGSVPSGAGLFSPGSDQRNFCQCPVECIGSWQAAKV